jgi:hypothetical protein
LRLCRNKRVFAKILDTLETNLRLICKKVGISDMQTQLDNLSLTLDEDFYRFYSRREVSHIRTCAEKQTSNLPSIVTWTRTDPIMPHHNSRTKERLLRLKDEPFDRSIGRDSANIHKGEDISELTVNNDRD